MKVITKKQEILLDEDIDEQEFVNIIDRFCKKNCYIYAVIPDFEEDFLKELSDDFIKLTRFSLPLNFPIDNGSMGYVKDSQKKYVYDFYIRCSSMYYLIFSETDVTEKLSILTTEKLDIYKVFEANKTSHITIGPDGKRLNIIDY